MYIERIHIKGFRLYKDFKACFNKKLNVLIGENNSGKTALIDAIKITLDTNSNEWVGLQESDFNDENGEELSVQLKFNELTSRDRATFLEHLSVEETEGGENIQVLYVNLVASKRYDPRAYNGIRIFQKYKSGYEGNGPSISPELLMYLRTTYLKPLRNAELELVAGRGSRISQLLTGSLNGPNILKELIELIIESDKEISQKKEIKEIEESIKNKLQNLIFQSDQDLFSPILSILGVNSFSEMSEPQQKNAFRVIMEKITLALDENHIKHGLGYSNLLFMAAEMLFLDKQDDGFLSLLIEEPEAHLHPQLQLKFIQFIQSLENIQCFMTTHSPNLASKISLDHLIIMNKGISYSLSRGATLLDEPDYIFLEKFLDVTKANMFFARGVIIVEGDGENILLPTIARLLGFPFENYGISIVNGQGLTYKRYAKIYRSKNEGQILPINVACLTDKDIWPLKADISRSPVGFKERKKPDRDLNKKGNLNRWEDYSREKIECFMEQKREIDGDNVITFISDLWTFEYCLAFYGLADELVVAINLIAPGAIDTKDLSTDQEEKAIQIYKVIEENAGKTTYNYSLVSVLERKYNQAEEGVNSTYLAQDLYKKLPPYIQKALSHVLNIDLDEYFSSFIQEEDQND